MGPQPRTVEDRFWAKVRTGRPGSCWAWTASTNIHGYGHMGGVSGKGTLAAHRVSWEIHHGPIPDGLWVLHACDNPSCVNPGHLFLGSPRENTLDMIEKGRNVRGQDHHRARLTEGNITAIRNAHKTGTPQKELAAKYGVSKQHVSRVVRGLKWRHIL